MCTLRRFPGAWGSWADSARSLSLARVRPNSRPRPLDSGRRKATGLVLDVRADSVATFEVTKVSCIPAMRAPVTAPPSGAIGAFTMPGSPVTFVVSPGSTPTEARVHFAYAASDMIIHRIDRKPAVCDKPTPDTPIVELRCVRARRGRSSIVFRREEGGLGRRRRGEPIERDGRDDARAVVRHPLGHDLAATGRALVHRRPGDQ